MNTQLAFAFGMLAMVAITMLITIVVGMVKVIRLEREIKNLQQVLGRETEMIHRHVADVERNIYHDLHETRRNFEENLNNLQREVDDRTENLRRELTAYTDSRIDKSLGIGLKEKQLLKS